MRLQALIVTHEDVLQPHVFLWVTKISSNRCNLNLNHQYLAFASTSKHIICFITQWIYMD